MVRRSPQVVAAYLKSPELEGHIKAEMGLLTVFPFVMTHHDQKVAPNWVRIQSTQPDSYGVFTFLQPPAPAHIVWFAKNVAPWWHRRLVPNIITLQ
jgi:hypothetical protein